MTPSPLWHRAALLGSVWASLEIIVGSFLHNIHFPLAGTILASLGVVLLVAGRKIWDEPGLLWRAGVVCALMKSLSPSAIILGPMAGIMLEALVLEAATRLLGPTLPGVLLGGALGSSLPLLQKAAGLLITYGADVARLYAAMVEAASAALAVTALGPLELYLLLLGLSAMLGLAASLAGIRLARTASTMPVRAERERTEDGTFDFEEVDPAQPFSPKLIALHLAVLPAGLVALGSLPLLAGLVLVLAYLAACLARYRRLAKRLGRPRLWLEFAVITLLAGFFLGNIGTPGLTVAGLGAGAAMTLRAAFIIVAFSSISVELRNPAVVHWFIRRGFGEISSALGVAFRALPVVIRVLDQDRGFVRHPWKSLARVLGTAVAWVEEQQPHPVTYLLTGNQGSGKTSSIQELARELRLRGISVGGLAAPVVFDNGERIGYDLLDLASGVRRPLCRRCVPPTGVAQGPFHFFPEAICSGTELLSSREVPDGVLCIDELGPLELAGQGWSPAMDRLLHRPPRALVLTVRPALVEAVLQRWNLAPRLSWRAGVDDLRELVEALADTARGARFQQESREDSLQW